MKKHKFETLKDEKGTLPIDCNEDVEKRFAKYGNKKLLAGIKKIREGKIYTRKPGAYLQNLKYGVILASMDAHNGVIKEFSASEILFPKKSELAEQLKKDLWSDEYTIMVIPRSERNQTVDFHVDRKAKIKQRWDTCPVDVKEKSKFPTKEDLEKANGRILENTVVEK